VLLWQGPLTQQKPHTPPFVVSHSHHSQKVAGNKRF